MKRFKTFLGTSLSVALGVVFLSTASQTASATCQLSANGKIKQMVYIVFDNLHLRRDNPNVPSDLEQMPNLLNFLTNNGTISGNHHTPLISHTATDILTGMTGLYGDRMGVPVANSYGFFKPDGSVGFSSSFLYWTALGGDGKPLMINELGKTAPAPWVPFTRAGCDVGGFSVANIEFERLPDDVTTFFGAGSPTDMLVRSQLASSDAATQQLPNTNFLGIAIHCAIGSKLCNTPLALNDPLPDEPGGYSGFKGLFGNINVQPVISPTGSVKDLDGNVIADAFGQPGFPNIFNPLATQSLGYAATMLEAGVQVVYVEIADAHDDHAIEDHPFGAGETAYVAQLKAYDVAFGKFFNRLQKDGITKENTLFVVLPDENDHFVGGPPSPTTCDGINVACTYKNKGEIDVVLNDLAFTQRGNNTAFSVHSDDAPTVYIIGNPAPTDLVTRTMEHDFDALVATNPITGNTDKLSRLLADQAEMNLLHMVTKSPARTPTFTMFGDDNYFFFNARKLTNCATPSACVFEETGFAWNHGDFQQEITRAWLGMVGPGVQNLGRHDDVFSDHTDVRPTMMALLGLKDDYVHDGRVLAEWINQGALSSGIRQHQENFVDLVVIFKQLNAPLGELGRSSLVFANRSITGTDQTYAQYLTKIGDITTERNKLADEIKAALNGAAFGNAAIDEGSEEDLGNRARALIDRVKQIAPPETE